MCRSQVLVFHYQPAVCSGTSALHPSRRSEQQQPRGKWCQGRSSPSWWIPDAWICYFATTSSHTAKKKTNPKTKQKTSLKFSEPSSNSLEAQYFANGILFVSPLLFVTHRALIPFVLFCFVLFLHNMFLCQQANSLIHHSLQSAVNSIFIPGGTSLLLPFFHPISYFSLNWYFFAVS